MLIISVVVSIARVRVFVLSSFHGSFAEFASAQQRLLLNISHLLLLAKLRDEPVIALRSHETRAARRLQHGIALCGRWRVDEVQVAVGAQVVHQRVGIAGHRESYATTVVGVFTFKISDELNGFQENLLCVHELAILPLNRLGHVFVRQVTIARDICDFQLQVLLQCSEVFHLGRQVFVHFGAQVISAILHGLG